MQFRDHPGREGKRDAYQFNPRLLKVMEGYNVRNLDAPDEREALDELKAQIRDDGVQTPLEVRLVGEDVFIIAGHRRHKVVMELIEEGHPIESVLVIPEQQGRNDADRDAGLITSNSGKPLTPLQQAEVIRRLIRHGWDNDKIAARTGKSKAVIRNLIALLETPEAVKEMVREGSVSATTAVNEVRRNGAAAATETLKAAKETMVANGKRKVTPRQIAKPSNGKHVPQAVSPAKQELINTLGLFAREAALQNLDERDDEEVVEIKIGFLKQAYRVHRKVTGIDP